MSYSCSAYLVSSSEYFVHRQQREFSAKPPTLLILGIDQLKQEMRLIIQCVDLCNGNDGNPAEHVEEFYEVEVIIPAHVGAFGMDCHLAELETLLDHLGRYRIIFILEILEHLKCTSDGKLSLGMRRCSFCGSFAEHRSPEVLAWRVLG